MGSPEDKVKFLDDDLKTPPPTSVVEENEEDSNFCYLTCASLTVLVIFGVFFALIIFPSCPRHDSGNNQGYKAYYHKIKPEDFEDFREMHNSRMEEERRHMKMFPEFRSWSKHAYPKRHTHPNPRHQTHTDPTDKTHTNPTRQTRNNPTDRTHLTKTYDPPPRSEKAKTARYIVHISDWGSISTISASMDGAPFGMAASFSDGTVANSTGVPYFYLTKDDPVVKNMKLNAMASLALSEAQSGYCKEHDWDPEEPLCSRVTVIGKLVHVGPDEEKFAENALFSRHPVMKTWPKDHGWQTLKLEITHVWLLDFYGPATMVPVKDYFNVKL